jgi:hypothetical protein
VRERRGIRGCIHGSVRDRNFGRSFDVMNLLRIRRKSKQIITHTTNQTKNEQKKNQINRQTIIRNKQKQPMEQKNNKLKI